MGKKLEGANLVLHRRADSRRRNTASPPILLPITKVEIDPNVA